MMPNSLHLLSCRPTEGFYTSEVAAAHDWPLRTFLPVGYEPNYPYPLLVFLHGHGSSEDQVLRFAPRISRRNYVCIAPRGPHAVGQRDDGRAMFSWGPDGHDDPNVEEYIFRAIEQTRQGLHIHSERIFLVGFREGAAVAYRLGLMNPERFAGVVALNGALPRHGTPRLRLPEVRKLRLLIGHGIANAIVPISMARQDARLFYTAGLDVVVRNHATTHKIHVDMLKDIDRWVQDQINEDYETLPG